MRTSVKHIGYISPLNIRYFDQRFIRVLFLDYHLWCTMHL